MRSSLPFLITLWLLSLAVPTVAQFGIPQKRDTSKIQELLQNEQQGTRLAEALMQAANQENYLLDEQDAIDMASVLLQAASDPETLQMVLRIQEEEKETIAELRETATLQDIMLGLKQVLSEMKMLEVVFEDKERALALMQEDGMIDPARLPEYQKDPGLLEQDTRKGLYFTFVTLCVTAGFL